MKDNKQNKGVMVALVIFAVIGALAVIGLGAFGVIRLVDKVKEQKASSMQGTQNEQTLEEAILEQTENLEENNENGENGNTEEVGTPSNMSASEAVLKGDGDLQIVFLGDSIIDNFRDKTGICNIVAESLDATVYNLGIGGVSASVPRGEGLNEPAAGTVSGSASGAMLAEVLAGIHTIDCIYDCTAKEIIKEHMDDFKNTDLFVVEYGINDFRSGRDTSNPDDNMDPTTYYGAMRHVVFALQKVAPDAKIILCEPSYCYYKRDNGEYIGNSYTLDNGLGAMVDYGGKAQYIADDLGLYFYWIGAQGITVDNSLDMLMDDGTHLNELGRRVYAQNLMEYMVRQGLIEDYKWSGESYAIDIEAVENQY